MKFFIIFVMCFVAAQGELSEEYKKKLLEKLALVSQECMKEVKATEDDINEIMEEKPISRREGKCFLSCLNEKFEMQTKDGKISMEGVKKLLEPVKADNAEIYNKLIQMAEKCSLEVEKISDKCDMAAKLNDCYTKVAKEVGLDKLFS